jgi:hypothetical protein
MATLHHRDDLDPFPVTTSGIPIDLPIEEVEKMPKVS